MPPEGVPRIPHSEILSYEEINIVAEAAAELGINKIRLTGGEPLIRAELPKLIRMISRIKGIDEISLTTNGILLKEYALQLKQAGLRRVNISLDTLKANRFREITRLGELKDVLAGIRAARDAGFDPIKINMVVMQGVNDDEILDFAKMSYSEQWHVRFIEQMPFADTTQFIPSSELLQRIEALGKLAPHLPVTGNGPARYYRLPGAKGSIGFISPISEPFCSNCNRIRLTSDGKLYPCLLEDGEIDLKGPLRNNASTEEIKHLILATVAAKPDRHHVTAKGCVSPKQKMYQVGG